MVSTAIPMGLVLNESQKNSLSVIGEANIFAI